MTDKNENNEETTEDIERKRRQLEKAGLFAFRYGGVKPEDTLKEIRNLDFIADITPEEAWEFAALDIKAFRDDHPDSVL
jgi:hypothetical protein